MPILPLDGNKRARVKQAFFRVVAVLYGQRTEIDDGHLQKKQMKGARFDFIQGALSRTPLFIFSWREHTALGMVSGGVGPRRPKAA